MWSQRPFLMWERRVHPRLLISFILVLYPNMEMFTITKKGWMTSQIFASMCFWEGKYRNGSRNGSSIQEAFKPKLWWDGAWCLQEESKGHWVTLELFLILPQFLRFAEIQSLSIFEGLIIYFVDVFCLFFSRIRPWALFPFIIISP